jgi:hypothetical protein
VTPLVVIPEYEGWLVGESEKGEVALKKSCLLPQEHPITAKSGHL